MALGDLDVDGRLDVAVIDHEGDAAFVLLGQGNGTFGAPASFATGPDPWGVAIGDLDSDGLPDLAVANYFYPNGSVSILRGIGSGVFAPKVDYAANVYTMSIGIADLDLDGALDVVATNAFTLPSVISLFRGRGDGTLEARDDFFGGSKPNGLAVGDFDEDGVPDMGVSLQGGNGTISAMILLDATGRSARGRFFSSAAGPRSVAFADLDENGQVDMLVAHGVDASLTVRLGLGMGQFAAPTHHAIGGEPLSVDVGDFNGDGSLMPSSPTARATSRCSPVTDRAASPRSTWWRWGG